MKRKLWAINKNKKFLVTLANGNKVKVVFNKNGVAHCIEKKGSK